MTPLEIHVLSDGKPGHENQSYGLAEAIGRLRPVTTSKIHLAELPGPFARLKKAFKESELLPKPRLLIGAGHAVHPALLALSRAYDVPCVLLMKPTLPAALFDLLAIRISLAGIGVQHFAETTTRLGGEFFFEFLTLFRLLVGRGGGRIRGQISGIRQRGTGKENQCQTCQK